MTSYLVMGHSASSCCCILNFQQQIHLHLYHLLQKRSLVPHFMQIIATTCLLLQMMKQQTFRLFTLAYKVFRALFHSLLPSVLIMSAI